LNCHRDCHRTTEYQGKLYGTNCRAGTANNQLEWAMQYSAVSVGTAQVELQNRVHQFNSGRGLHPTPSIFPVIYPVSANRACQRLLPGALVPRRRQRLIDCHWPPWVNPVGEQIGCPSVAQIMRPGAQSASMGSKSRGSINRNSAKGCMTRSGQLG